MKERIRRALIFVTIIGAGTFLILFDLPLLMILPLILLIAGVLLILSGAVTVGDLKALGASLKRRGKTKPAADPAAPQAASPSPAGRDTPAKKRFPPNLGSLFRKKPKKSTPAKGATMSQKPAVGTKKKISLHVSALLSSAKTLGTLVTSRKKPDPDKLKKIDNLLDAAVSEKAGASMRRSVGILDQVPPMPGAGALSGGYGKNQPMQKPRDDDPFLSLSNDELESGLLDELEDEGTPQPAPPQNPTETQAPVFTVEVPEGGEGTPISEPDIPLPPQEISSSGEDMALENEPELEGLPVFEGLESVDDNLGELENLNLDSVNLDDEPEENPMVTRPPRPAPATAAPVPPASPVPPALSSIPAAPEQAPLFPPPAPAGSSKSQKEQAEIAAFAAGTGGDEDVDMLSSLAADIKSAKKEVDLSLLRDLKDFKAEGKTLETELSDIYATLNTAMEIQKGSRPSQAKNKKNR